MSGSRPETPFALVDVFTERPMTGNPQISPLQRPDSVGDRQ